MEKFVECVVGLGGQPCNKTAASAARAEHARIEIEWGCAGCVGSELLEHVRDVGLSLAQRCPQRSAPVLGEIKQLVLAEPEQWALEYGREREVVLLQQDRVGQHQQIH